LYFGHFGSYVRTYNALYVLILAIDALYPQNVVAKVQSLEATLLSQQYDHDAASPVQTFAEELLDGVLRSPDWNAINELQSRPKAMELRALIHVDNPVGRWRTTPHRVVQIALHAVENNFKNAEATAKTLTSQQISLSCYHCLLLVKIIIIKLIN